MFTIGFVGIMRYADPIFKLIDAVSDIHLSGEPIKCNIAGGHMGDLLAEVKSRIRHPSVFHFEGVFDYEVDIKRIYSELSVIYAVYDKDDPNCNLAMPTKYYESILARKPIMVAKGTHIASVVERAGIGIALMWTMTRCCVHSKMLLRALAGMRMHNTSYPIHLRSSYIWNTSRRW